MDRSSITENELEPDIVWQGVTQSGTFNPEFDEILQEYSNAARNYEWEKVLEFVSKGPEIVNLTRPSGKSLFAPLHQAAHGNAPPEVINSLIEYGAWRTLQNARGERPVDVAERKGNTNIIELLTPVYLEQIPNGVLCKIQEHFHETILERVSKVVDEYQLRLPELEPLLEIKGHKMWFPVPGMYGGFSYQFEKFGVEAVLVSSSWSRVSEGSGQKHVITTEGSELVDEGFI